LFSCLVPKDEVPIAVEIDGERRELPNGSPHPAEARSDVSKGVANALANDAPFETRAAHAPQDEGVAGAPQSPQDEGGVTVPLIALAWARSGDKGNDCNIGVIARRPEYLPIVRKAITPQAVADYFAHHLEGEVERYDVPGIRAVNFVLHDVLGGGGIASLRNDPQGKGFAQMLLDFPVPVERRLAAELAARTDP
jgi:hypothetical protein